jgi:hypothetical protein
MIEQYYNEIIKVCGMPYFKDLTEDEILQIKNSLGFAGYGVKKAVDQFGKACLDFIESIKKFNYDI